MSLFVRAATAPRARRSFVLVGVALALFCMAPTPGDVGGCGREPEPLNERSYAEVRRRTDCTRCAECGIATERCADACRTDVAAPIGFPPGCEPLVRDGEVCIRALQAASCERYTEYLSDLSPTVPTECEFCRARSEPTATPPLLGDAGR